MSTFALNLTTAVGLALAMDYSLFIVARYREERGAGLPHQQALEHATAAGGRVIAVSAGTVAVSLLGLLLFPLYFLRSLALAGISVVLLAAAASLLVIPAALACLGERVASRDRLARWRTGPRAAGRWHRLALAVMRRPLSVLVLTGTLLLLLALPFRHAAFGLHDERALPRDAAVVRATEDLHTRFPHMRTEVDVVLPRWWPNDRTRAAQLDAYARRLSALPGVQGLRTATGTYLDGRPVGRPCLVPARAHTVNTCEGAHRFAGSAGTWLALNAPASPYTSSAATLVHRLQDQPAPVRPVMGGATAEFLDTQALLARRLPGALAVVAAATLALLFAFTRSLFLPLKALMLNLLSLTATFGALVYVFQEGHLRWLVGDFEPTGTVNLMLPPIAFFLAFGISMDYEVLLLARIGEAYRRTRDTTRATAEGLQAAAPLFTASAALVLIVLLALAATPVTNLKCVAVTVALSVCLDALLVRPLLVPAAMQLAGAANWWLPRPLQRLWPKAAPHPTHLQHTGLEPTARKGVPT
ncbi:MMPL family transporter [Streptomyces sp. NPDC005930]|uniref:MMPL family transporter n=1 Tax=Streptomyces sp. NPDC005930 TaxID=3364736 RepID=UPI0036CC5E69